MPHLIVEYAEASASEAQVARMLDAVHAAAESTGLFEPTHIKTRAVPVRHYRTGTGRHPFIHAQLRIKAGRDDAQKKALSHAVLAALKAQEFPVQVITVEVVDMDAGTYAKWSR
jgi:5-carboxymethyl-2-hydroxymuconate isomerase